MLERLSTTIPLRSHNKICAQTQFEITQWPSFGWLVVYKLTRYGLRSFSVASAKLWNALPLDIRTSDI